MRLFHFIVPVLILTPTPGLTSNKVATTTCDSLGRPGTSALSFQALAGQREVQIVRTSGELDVGTGSNFLCPPSYGLSSSRPPFHCRQVAFDWGALGTNPRDGTRILRQWRGAQVEITGTLHPNPDRRGNTFEDLGAIDDVSSVRVLSEPPASEYCIGAELPGLPSPWEERSRTTARNEAVCVDGTYSHQSSEVAYCLEPTKPRLWRIESAKTESGSWTVSDYAEQPFVPPTPFATRDVFELTAVKDRVFFTLFSGELFLWDRVSTKSLREASVDLLNNTSREFLYYRVRELSPMGTVVWNAVERASPEGEIETVWKSSTERVNYLRVHPSGDLQIFLFTKTGRRVVECEAGRCE